MGLGLVARVDLQCKCRVNFKRKSTVWWLLGYIKDQVDDFLVLEQPMASEWHGSSLPNVGCWQIEHPTLVNSGAYLFETLAR